MTIGITYRQDCYLNELLTIITTVLDDVNNKIHFW